MATTTHHKNPLREGMPEDQSVRPAAIIIFGASGDLTKRKLVPAIYNLALSRLLPSGFAMIGVARRPKPDFADEMRESVGKFSRRKPVEDATWNELAKSISPGFGKSRSSTWEGCYEAPGFDRRLCRLPAIHGIQVYEL